MSLQKISSKFGSLSIPAAIVIASIVLAVAYFLCEAYKIESANKYKNREIELRHDCFNQARSWAIDETIRICKDSPEDCPGGYRKDEYQIEPFQDSLQNCLAGYGLQYTGPAYDN